MIQIHKLGSLHILDKALCEEREIEAMIIQKIGEQPKCGVLERSVLGRILLGIINPFIISCLLRQILRFFPIIVLCQTYLYSLIARLTSDYCL